MQRTRRTQRAQQAQQARGEQAMVEQATSRQGGAIPPAKRGARGERIERPEGNLGRPEITRLASRLESLPTGTHRVWIDWQNVRHLDFRAIPALAETVARMRRLGLEVRGIGCDPYLAAILRLALPREDADWLIGGTSARLVTIAPLAAPAESLPAVASYRVSAN